MRRFGKIRFHATGGSMLPAIVAGDLLEFRACATDDLRPGQVALVLRDQRLVAHRIVAINETGVVTRGDALAADDPSCPHGDLLGVLTAHQRGASRLLHPGGRHWRLRQRLARWLVRRVAPVRALFARVSALAALVA